MAAESPQCAPSHRHTLNPTVEVTRCVCPPPGVPLAATDRSHSCDRMAGLVYTLMPTRIVDFVQRTQVRYRASVAATPGPVASEDSPHNTVHLVNRTASLQDRGYWTTLESALEMGPE